jgi:hypothetical protein
VNELAGFAVLLKSVALDTSLVVEHDHFRSPANLAVIAEAVAHRLDGTAGNGDVAKAVVASAACFRKSRRVD